MIDDPYYMLVFPILATLFIAVLALGLYAFLALMFRLFTRG